MPLWGKPRMFDGPSRMTPAEIAASVHRSGRLQSAETALAAAKKRIAELRQQLVALQGQPNGPNSGEVDAELRRIDAEQKAVTDRLYAARREVLPLRAEHGAKVRAAMRPMIAATAGEALAAATALTE